MAVSDHGIGIAPADHERIFERFGRAVSSRNFGGLGLGLWITREILTQMGGSISVRELPWKGGDLHRGAAEEAAGKLGASS